MYIEPNFIECKVCAELTIIPGGVCSRCNHLIPLWESNKKLTEEVEMLKSIITRMYRNLPRKSQMRINITPKEGRELLNLTPEENAAIEEVLRSQMEYEEYLKQPYDPRNLKEYT